MRFPALFAVACLFSFSARAELPLRFMPEARFTVQDVSLSPQGRAEVALYADAGTWEAGKEHLKLFFRKYGYSYVSLNAEQLLSGALDELGVRLLVMPGGESWTYLRTLGDEGARIIRDFVEKGGAYAGICAGAFYATSMREGGYATGPYGIGLLEGTAYDGTALETEPFKEGMLTFDFLMKGFAPQYSIVLFGGPSFRYSAGEARSKGIEVLSRFRKINEPAMVRFHYGEGSVFLSGPHLEIEEPLTDWGPEYEDPDSEWPVLDAILSRRDLS